MTAPRTRLQPAPTPTPRRGLRARLTPTRAQQTALVGGAAAQPLPPDLVVAPLRDARAVAAAEARAAFEPLDPYDPWPETRRGYDVDLETAVSEWLAGVRR